ncbi:Oac1p Ecym_2469 [Eremothecium cymbalariae DBVPG|uniref:Mitochondrial oxaloacetate transport protein n=1 Tax=Eremothecium cymbalariae (strain CBS 270.75 / DBVPG 7215 / KCTC 17166 / NRRL Y-17582) TaxID=931890 RepID=G8JPT7_ERECY|nr:Hypothetical protein Ecym_2469 [Eremothecium cymbalariae DBVPG\
MPSRSEHQSDSPAGERNAAQRISKTGSFIAGGLAACIAVTFTNPVEVAKTRMQLQGELSAVGETIYKNPFQAMGLIGKTEGIRGLQKGLNCAYIYQIGLNGSRLGFYEPIRLETNKLLFSTKNPYVHQNMAVNIVAGTLSGMIGAVIGSPLYLIKTRMQSYSSAIQVGQQTRYSSIWNGITSIVKNHGIKGLFHGTDAAILRTGAGSAVQLPIYNSAKNFLLRNAHMQDGYSLHLIASTISGVGVAIVMNPWDVILTRVYNQSGSLYKGPIDCFLKTIKIEGPSALYKGFAAQLSRICPHTILCLTFLEQTMNLVYHAEAILLGP